MPDRRLPVVERSVQHFVERFRDVCLHAGIPGLGLLGDALHEGVRDPLRARRCIPDVDALVPAVASPQVVDDPEVVVLVQGVRRRKPVRGEAANVFIRQTGKELLVLARARDQKALRHEPRREGDPDACIVVRSKRVAGVGRVRVRGPAVAVHVDHTGDPGAQQPCRAQKRCRPRREASPQRERQQPGLEQPIPDPLLDGGDTVAVMMGVDHAGHDRESLGAQGRRAGMPAAQRLPVADFDNRLVLDAYRCVVQHRIAFCAAGDDPASADQCRVAHCTCLRKASAHQPYGPSRGLATARWGRVRPGGTVGSSETGDRTRWRRT